MSCVRANWKKKKQSNNNNNKTERERKIESFGQKFSTSFALAGNRTRASRVAGENSTTEPPVPFDGVPSVLTKKLLNIISVSVAVAFCFYSSITCEKAQRAKLNRALKKVLNINVW